MNIKTGFLLTLMLASPNAGASVSSPLVESSQEQAIRFARLLEEQPLGSDSPAMRKWLLRYLTETDDVTVTVCDLLGPIPAQQVPYGPELLGQMMFSNAAFQLSNPGQRNNILAVQLAGVTGTLRAYQRILTLHPEARIAYLDQLAARQQDGSFQAFMAPIVKKECS